MKTRLITLLFLVLIINFDSIYSQTDDEKSMFLYKGDALFELIFGNRGFNIRHIKYSMDNDLKLDSLQERIILKKSLKYYLDYIEKTDSSNNLIISKIGLIYYKLNQIDNSIKCFEKVLSNIRTVKGYATDVEKNLTELYFLKKEYQKALKFEDKIFLSNKYYTCGNAKAEDDIYYSLLLSQIYYKLNDFDKAFDYCIPQVLNFQLIKNDDLVDFSYKLLKEHFNMLKIKNEFQNSIENIKSYTNKDGKKIYYILFLQRKILTPIDFTNDDSSETIKEIIKKSKFYKLIMN